MLTINDVGNGITIANNVIASEKDSGLSAILTLTNLRRKITNLVSNLAKAIEDVNDVVLNGAFGLSCNNHGIVCHVWLTGLL